MGYEDVRDQHFPGSVGEREFVEATRDALAPLGFRTDATICAIATCRDEISQSWADSASRVWGPPFNLAGLGGMIFAGKTGFGAALAHGPRVDGRERYVFYGGPHVAIGPEGEPGTCRREGRDEPSTACGALLAVLGELREGRSGPIDDGDDVEIGLIRKRIREDLAGDACPELFSLTRVVHDWTARDLERLLEATVDTSLVDYAVATGIQIHGPGARNEISPGTFYAVVRGERRPLGPVGGVAT